MVKLARQKTFRRGINRLDDDDSKPKPPLDPIPEYEPKKQPELTRYEILVDPAFSLSDEAFRRIEKQIRQAVLMEVAVLDRLPEFRVSSSTTRGVRRIAVSWIRE